MARGQEGSSGRAKRSWSGHYRPSPCWAVQERGADGSSWGFPTAILLADGSGDPGRCRPCLARWHHSRCRCWSCLPALRVRLTIPVGAVSPYTNPSANLGAWKASGTRPPARRAAGWWAARSPAGGGPSGFHVNATPKGRDLVLAGGPPQRQLPAWPGIAAASRGFQPICVSVTGVTGVRQQLEERVWGGSVSHLKGPGAHRWPLVSAFPAPDFQARQVRQWGADGRSWQCPRQKRNGSSKLLLGDDPASLLLGLRRELRSAL